jgi:hypothetical protein
MKLFHPAFFDIDYDFDIINLRYASFKEACTFLPWTIITMGIISSAMRGTIRDSFNWSAMEGIKYTIVYFLIMLGPFLIFPLSIPIFLGFHYFISKRNNKNRMIDALRGKFHGK